MEIFTVDEPIYLSILGQKIILQQCHPGCYEPHFVAFDRRFLDQIVDAMKAAIAQDIFNRG